MYGSYLYRSIYHQMAKIFAVFLLDEKGGRSCILWVWRYFVRILYCRFLGFWRLWLKMFDELRFGFKKKLMFFKKNKGKKKKKTIFKK